MDAPRASRAPTIVAIAFLFATVALSAFLVSRQMDAVRGASAGVSQSGLIACCVAAFAGFVGLAWVSLQPSNSNRRAALLAFGFATAILLALIYNLVIHP